MSEPTLPPRLLETLMEMASYPNLYHFRKASCRLLAEIGYAVPVGGLKRPPYRITDAGRRYIENVKNGGPK